MTALVTSGNRLSVFTGSESNGFAVSDPKVFAGSLTRSSATIKISGKVQGALYTPDEVSLLSAVDGGESSCSHHKQNNTTTTTTPLATGIAVRAGEGEDKAVK